MNGFWDDYWNAFGASQLVQSNPGNLYDPNDTAGAAAQADQTQAQAAFGADEAAAGDAVVAAVEAPFEWMGNTASTIWKDFLIAAGIGIIIIALADDSK